MSSEEATPSSGIKDGDTKAKVDPDDNKYAKKPGSAMSSSAFGIIMLLLLVITLGALYLYNGTESDAVNPIKLNEPSHRNPSETVSDSLNDAKVVGEEHETGGIPGDDAAEDDGEDEESDEGEEGDEDEELDEDAGENQ
ncbi:hypothetical protein MHU86_5988 [Fragilaria crotonensis]|nr:hypothetical protein MHU86_5988 [Fragilaria crotonensis]